MEGDRRKVACRICASALTAPPALGYAGGKLEQRLKQLGTPAVVIIRYPAYGWCKFTHGRLPQSMIELHLRHEGDWDAMDYGWDIMIDRDVPAENIVAVVPLDDPAVAA